jgi:hypothetical protein
MAPVWSDRPEAFFLRLEYAWRGIELEIASPGVEAVLSCQRLRFGLVD